MDSPNPPPPGADLRSKGRSKEEGGGASLPLGEGAGKLSQATPPSRVEVSCMDVKRNFFQAGPPGAVLLVRAGKNKPFWSSGSSWTDNLLLRRDLSLVLKVPRKSYIALEWIRLD